MSSQQKFIDQIAPHAVRSMQETGILASLTIAQAILESGWGKESIGNNIFGIKAFDDWKGKKQLVKTTEYDANKKAHKVDAWFRDYDSIEESLNDHIKLFASSSKYANLKGETSFERACYLVWKDGYATDPNYPSLLVDIIKQWKLDQYDHYSVKEQTAKAEVAPQFEGARAFVMEKGISNGLDPKGTITREQAWSMIERLYKVIQEEQKKKGGK